MLEELKAKAKAEDYQCEFYDGALCILFRNGGFKSNGQPSRSWVGKVRNSEGKLFLTEMVVPFPPTWELNNIEGVMKFLQERYPNLAPGEELPDFED